MPELTITLLGTPVLRQRAREVEEVDDEVRAVVRSMFVTMYASDGQGLAAPQVGVSRRIAVVDVPTSDWGPHALINPRLTVVGKASARGVEGCLSIPGVREVVERPAKVVAEALDIDGSPIHVEAEGELARCLQHEIDHLDGTLYIDRLSPLSRRMLLDRFQKQRNTSKA
ncbi:MAG: peptide deformylase [Gemmatimonadota bacterium]|jgi:peptide deformylase